jgi:PIN domain nuclease of toxin-antitoxin system
MLDVAPHHLQTLASLQVHHRDPFDHMLIAQAITEEATFMSQDRHVTRYDVRVIACSD